MNLKVWFWEDGLLEIHHLCGEGNTAHYEKITESEVVPGIDLKLLRRCIVMVNHLDAIRTFQNSINLT